MATHDAANALEWHLGTDDEGEEIVRFVLRFGCEDMAVVRDPAIAGFGVTILPGQVCHGALSDERLVRLLPSWHGLTGIVHPCSRCGGGCLPLSAC